MYRARWHRSLQADWSSALYPSICRTREAGADRLCALRQRRKHMNMEHVGIALEIMGKGMGGIFAAIIIIMAAVMVLGSITKDHKDDSE